MHLFFTILKRMSSMDGCLFALCLISDNLQQCCSKKMCAHEFRPLGNFLAGAMMIND